jgi:predicted nicotinamide N-methyase
VLELGAGVGLCGIFLARFGLAQKVVLTDINEALALLRDNIQLNNVSASSSAMPLYWGNKEQLEVVLSQFEENTSSTRLVIASDCVYWRNLFQPLLMTLTALIHRGYHVIIAHVKRWKKDNLFFSNSKKIFDVELLLETLDYTRDEVSGSLRRKIHRIYRMKAKQSNNM